MTRLLVIGLDCETPQFVFDEWRSDLPNLDRLMKEGVHGKLESTIPPITVPAWSSMLSSKDPGQLGFYGFRKRKSYHYEELYFANASWLNMVEIWFGILKSKCLKYDHFFSVEQLRKAIIAFIDTWNEFYAHPFSWSYTGAELHGKAVRRFCRLLSIETDQRDAKFLTSRLLLMSNLSEKYLRLIPQTDLVSPHQSCH